MSHTKSVCGTIQSFPLLSNILCIWRLLILPLLGLFSCGSNLNSLISNRWSVYTPNHSALPSADPNISWNINCRGNTVLQLRPHSYQIEQKDYCMHLRAIIPACASHNSIWLFCKSVTLLIIFISGILSYLILHHCSLSAELLTGQSFPEVISDVSDCFCKSSSLFWILILPSSWTSFKLLGIFFLIITLYFTLYAFSTSFQPFLCPSYSSSIKPMFPFLTTTVSGETLSETSLKSRHIASTASALSTKPVTLS